MKEMDRMCGITKAILFDRDPMFTSFFWRGLFKEFGTKFNLSIAIIMKQIYRKKDLIRLMKICFGYMLSIG